MNLGLDDVIAVILAGGLGTRIRTLYPNIPKPMIPVRGKPFLEWIIRYLAAQGLRKAIISTGHFAETIEYHFASQPVENIKVLCARESYPLGTAGGFLETIKSVPETPQSWLVLNGDSLTFANLSEAAESLMDADLDGGLIGTEVDDAVRYGRLIFKNKGRLVRFEEKTDRGPGVVNTGIYFLNCHDLLEQFNNRRPLSFEKDVFPELLSQNANLRVHITRAPFLDIGTPETLALADDFIRQNEFQFA